MKPTLNWVTIANDNLASKRIRINAVQRHLGGSITRDPVPADIHIYSKHFKASERLGIAQGKTVYDVCDDRFNWGNKEVEKHYREMCDKATYVTCNTPVMQSIIKRETGRDAEVIPDSCEGEIIQPHVSDSVMWFGHRSNIHTLPVIKGMEIVTNMPSGVVNGCAVTEWSSESQRRAFQRNGIAVITHDKESAYKSHNRLTTAIRAGLFVVANPIPAYQEFSDFCWLGKNILEGIDWAVSHLEDAESMVRAGQEYSKIYQSDNVARQWGSFFESLD